MHSLKSATTLLFLACGLGIGLGAERPKGPLRLDLQDGDRVALLGDTLIEREPTYGYLEARLIAHFPDKNIVVRNLGWSADTVLGESRAGFDAPEKGFERLKDSLKAVKPTVVILGYGMAASFDGTNSIPKFKDDLDTLVSTIREISKPAEVRFMVITPVRHENLGGSLPSGDDHNLSLARYAVFLTGWARTNSFPVLSLFGANAPNLGAGNNLTDNGIHLNSYGYFRAGEMLEARLGGNSSAWRLGITADRKVRPGSGGMEVTNLTSTAAGVSFTATHAALPFAVPHNVAGAWRPEQIPPMLQIQALKPGRYTLKIDGQPVAVHTSEEWNKGQRVDAGPDYDQSEELRRTIIKKNQLYFYRWRPQNETYLFGFRKNEQGKNGKEIPMFDPLVTEQENRIAELRKPKAHQYEVVPAQPGDEAKLKSPVSDHLPEPKQTQFTPAKAQALPDFELSPELEVSLYAENPDLAKPIQMNFDPQGRLWVASSSVYPQIQPGQTANDKIVILEDTDHDGKVDKSTVFAEGLLIPTGIEPGNGGAYVANSTELLFFKDIDGDGKADQRQVILSGFGTEDTHHILHTLRWGHDGQLYFNQSIYIHSHLETPHGVVRLNSGGIYHLRPQTMELGIIMRGLVNGWGHHFDHYGQSFATDGAGGEGINWVVPGGMYVTYAGARRILSSVSPGNYPKFASLETIESEHFPPEWQGNFITCDFRAHRIVRFSINDQDSGYVTKEMPDVMRSTNVTFRPIDVKMGPDGALYVADWSNPIIQHGEVDFRDPRRDHEHGRIWRVTVKGRPLVKPVDFTKASTRELLDNLLSTNGYTRQRSRRVLLERNPTIQLELNAWTQAQTSEMALLEALWMYQGLDVVEPALLDKVLHSQDGRIRAAAARVISYWHPRLKAPAQLLAPLLKDNYLRVRLEAVRSLAELQTAEAADLVLSLTDKPLDRFLDYAVWLSINDLAKPWVAALQSGTWKVEGHEKELEFGLRAIPPELASTVLAGLLERAPIARDGSGPWIDLIGKAGGKKELRALFDQILKKGFEAPATAKALGALAEAARLRQQRPDGDLAGISDLLSNSDPAIQAESAKLAGVWKISALTNPLLAEAGDKTKPLPIRDAAFQSLREIGGGASIEGLKRLAAKDNDLTGRQRAVQALAALDLKAAIPIVIEVLTDTASEADSLSLWRSVLSIKGASAQVASALPKSGLPAVMAKTGLRAAREGGRNEPNLILALARNIDAEDEAKNLTPAELQELITGVSTKGNAARGELIYRRPEIGCVGCHSIGGVGGKVGPDLTSMGASAQVDYIVESVQFPNRKVKEGFHSLLIETKDGQEFSGILVRETGDQLILRDASNKDVSVAKNNIEKKTISGSLMPAGLIDALSTGDQTDLYRFLSELGKPGAYDASKGNVARLWRLFPVTVDTAQFGDEGVLSKGINTPDWVPSFSFVDGRFPKAELEKRMAAVSYRNPDGVYGAVQFEAAKPGVAHFQIENLGGAPVWIDGKSAVRNNDIAADVTAGTHTLVIRFDGKKLPEYVRVTTNDGTFLTN
jgi:putative heme-binding domain-containing protein